MVETFVPSTDDVVAFLTDQHNLIKDMFDDVVHATDTKAREKAFTELRQLLAVHETAEEMIVHPYARRALDGGDRIVGDRLKEEHGAKEMLAELEAMDIDSDEFIRDLTVFRTAVVDHAEREETDEFRKLATALDDDDRERMAKAVQAAQAIAPTRPHPGVESAAANLAVGPFASMLDRARDALQSALR